MTRRRSAQQTSSIGIDAQELSSSRTPRQAVQLEEQEDGDNIVTLLEDVAVEAAEAVTQLEDSLCQWWQDLVVRCVGRACAAAQRRRPPFRRCCLPAWPLLLSRAQQRTTASTTPPIVSCRA
jgi:hypothetical protein